VSNSTRSWPNTVRRCSGSPICCRDRGQAEDLVQEALLKLSRRQEAITHPQAYARRIVVNDYLGWRRRRVSTEVVGDVPDTAVPGFADDVADRDLVWRIIGRLPKRQRAVLVLRYYEALGDAEVAQLLGCAEGTVRSLATRAFEALRSDPQLAGFGAPVQVVRGDSP
jgi:RNA polymerase sigma factor (sigma-70 family)